MSDKFFGDGTRWLIQKSRGSGYWRIYAPLSASRWVKPAHDQLLTTPSGFFLTFEAARAAFAAGHK